MAKIKQYRPAFFTGFENEEKEFNSLEELFAIDFVDNFKKTPNNKVNPNFHQFSISTPSVDLPHILMAEYKGGAEWWVVGYIDDGEAVRQLPKWVPNDGKEAKGN